MRYFKIKTGYKDEDFIPIDETELEVAMYAFLTDSKAVFKNGVVNGKNIMSITEDWHRAKGWNYGYKLTPEDFAEISRDCGEYVGLIAEVKNNVQRIIESGRPELIGKTDYTKMRTLPGRHETGPDELHVMRQLPKLT